MTELILKVLGTLEFAALGKPIPHFRSNKIRALLVYLALEADRPHERRALAGLFWPEFPESVSLRNLRKALFYLRQAIDQLSPQASDSLLIVDRKTVQLKLNNLMVDAVQFEHLLSDVENHSHRHLHLCQDCLERLVEAIALYQGELLAGFSLRDVVAFEEWLLFWRERLHQQAISALDQLTAVYLERGEHKLALTYATHQLGLDCFREEAHRQLMRLLTLDGQHNKALAQYESCHRLLRDELNVEPAAETTALYQQIQAAQRGEAIPEVTHETAVLHYFPTQFTPFIGRKETLQQIMELFLDPECRLLTLVGVGGMGKTRLAIRAAEQLADKGSFANDIYFFSLTAVHTTDSLLMALVTGLDIALSERTTPKDRLLDYLRQRDCLLLLDNFEQLVDNAALLSEMLAAAPNLRLLVTSQLPLQLRAERRLKITGLSYPAPDQPDQADTDLTSYSAIRLFAESARYADAAFRLHEENEKAVLQICQIVQGVPLALELAAAWVNVMDCAAIVNEIGRSLEFLSLTPQDKPSRHQSMAAIFAYSWQLLGSAEQIILGQLAIFHGSFSLEAAMTISEATPLTLARLLDRSLLQHRKDGRYELHGMLRLFIDQQIGKQDEQITQQYINYYLSLVTAQESAFYGPLPRQAVAALQGELDNIRQAWQWAVEYGHWVAVEQSQEGLGRFYAVAALLQEGEAVLTAAHLRIEASHVEELKTKSHLLVWRAYFVHRLGRHAEAIQLAQHALEYADQDEAIRAEIHSLLGGILPADGKAKEAIAYLKQAIVYYRTTTNLEQLSKALRYMVLACLRGGNHNEMLHYSQQAIPLHQALEHKQGLAQLYNVMAGAHYEQDDLPQALIYIQQAQELYEAIDDKLDAAVVASNLATLYSSIGQFEQALTSNQRAIDISLGMGDRPSLSRDLSNRGNILSTMGEFNSSLDYYYRALEIEKALDNKARIAYFQAGIANVYRMEGNEETALSYYDLALPVLLQQANPFHIVGPLLDKADLLVQRSEFTSAGALNEQALALAKEINLPEYVQRSRVLTAKVAFGEGDKAMAQRQLDELLAETEDEAEQAALYYELWQMTQDSAMAQAALAAYQQTHSRVPSYINKKRLMELTRLVA